MNKKFKILSFFALTILVSAFASCSASKNDNSGNDDTETVKIKSDDDELRIKLYLVKKYNPGNCFGMPKIEDDRFKPKIDTLLISKVKQILNISSNKDAESIVRRLNKINVNRAGENLYYFDFADGRCCNITYYKGKIEIISGEFREEILEQKKENVPC